MAEPTAEERRKELADAFADGLDIFRTREAERIAKEQASNPPKEPKDDDTGGNSKPFLERLLGY